MTRELSPLEISDRLLINDLLDAYAAGCDSKDWQLVRTLFTPDAVLDYTASGGPRGDVDKVIPWLEQRDGRSRQSRAERYIERARKTRPKAKSFIVFMNGGPKAAASVSHGSAARRTRAKSRRTPGLDHSPPR